VAVAEVICSTVPQYFLSVLGERRNWRL